jgi:hypothetical protein
MLTVAVVAHAGKSFGGGLRELREVLAREGFADRLWYEVAKSRKAAKYARRALAHGAEVVFVWGGGGTPALCRRRGRDGGCPCDPPGWHSESLGGEPAGSRRPH